MNEQVNRYEKFTDIFDENGITYRLTYVQIQEPNFLKTLDPANPPKELILETEQEIYAPEKANYPITTGLCVISKYRTRLQDHGEPIKELLAQYYMIDATIYQAPDLYSLVTSNFRTAIFNLREAIRDADSAYKWTPEMRYQKANVNIPTKPPFLFGAYEMENIIAEHSIEKDLQKYFIGQVIAQLPQ